MRFTSTAFWLLSASLLTGCGLDQDTHVQTKSWDFQLGGASDFALFDADDLSPPPQDLTFEVVYVAGANRMDMYITGAPAGAEVRIYGSPQEGYHCRNSACLDLAQPVRNLGRKNADADGDMHVQTQARGDVWLQAMVRDPSLGNVPLMSQAVYVDAIDDAFVEGCMDSAALNYDPSATSDSGACEYAPVPGCVDELAVNYEDWATEDDGSCEYCLDDDADSICDDVDDCFGVVDVLGTCNGSCFADADADAVCDDVDACIDVDADAICDDLDDCVGELDALQVCNGWCALDADGDGVCDILPSGADPAELPAECGNVTYSTVDDEDGDGVADYYDHCRGTSADDVAAAAALAGASLPEAFSVDERGCVVVDTDSVTLGAISPVPVHFGLDDAEATYSRACPESGTEEVRLTGDAAILTDSGDFGEIAFHLFEAEILLGREDGASGINRVQGEANFGFTQSSPLNPLRLYNNLAEDGDFPESDEMVEVSGGSGGGLARVALGYDYPSQVGALAEVPLDDNTKWLYFQFTLDNSLLLSSGEATGINFSLPQVEIPGFPNPLNPLVMVNPELEAIYVNSGPIQVPGVGSMTGAFGLSNYPAFTFEPAVLLPDSVLGSYTYETGETFSYTVDHGNVDANIDDFMGQIYMYVEATVPLPKTAEQVEVTGSGEAVLGLAEGNEGQSIPITALGSSTGFRMGFNASASISIGYLGGDHVIGAGEPIISSDVGDATFMYEWQYTDNDMSGSLSAGDDDRMAMYGAMSQGFAPQFFGYGEVPFVPSFEASASAEITLLNPVTAAVYDNDISIEDWEIKGYAEMGSTPGFLTDYGIEIEDPLEAKGLIVLNGDGLEIEAFLESTVDTGIGLGDIEIEASAFAYMNFPFDYTDDDLALPYLDVDGVIIEIHADFDAGFYMCPLAFVSGVGDCTYDFVTDTTLCGLETSWDATVCGASYVEDGAICGWNYVQDGAECGWDSVVCGTEYFVESVEFVWECTYDWDWYWCDCWTDWLGTDWCSVCCNESYDVYCDVENSCDLPASCYEYDGAAFESCEITSSCSVPSSCEDLSGMDCNSDNAEMWVEVWLGVDVSNADCLYISGEAGMSMGIDGLFSIDGEVGITATCDYIEACVDSSVGDVCGTIDY